MFLLLGVLAGCDSRDDADSSGAGVAAVTKEEPEQIKVCAECHRKAGRTGTPFWPKMQGKSRAELVTLLESYREKRLKNVKMNAVAHSLSDEDIRALADYYAR